MPVSALIHRCGREQLKAADLSAGLIAYDTAQADYVYHRRIRHDTLRVTDVKDRFLWNSQIFSTIHSVRCT